MSYVSDRRVRHVAQNFPGPDLGNLTLHERRGRLARMFHQRRAQVGCDAARLQGARTLRASARKA